MKISSLIPILAGLFIILLLVGSVIILRDYLDTTTFMTAIATAIATTIATVISTAITIPFWIQQLKDTRQQSEAIVQSHLNARFHKAIEMIYDPELNICLNGIEDLKNLAEEHPLLYHVRVMELFCKAVQEKRNYEDIQKIMSIIGQRNKGKSSKKIRKAERDEKYRLDLSGADLSCLSLVEADLSRADLSGVDLSGVNMSQANLSGSDMSKVNVNTWERAQMLGWGTTISGLEGVDLSKIILTGATLKKTNLSGANLSCAEGLTQVELNKAIADPSDPPILDGAIDPVTEQPLVWQTT